MKCVFGGAGCSWTPPICAFLFITSYLLTVCGTALLLRYSEGATLLAIVLVSLACPSINCYHLDVKGDRPASEKIFARYEMYALFP